MKIYNTVFFSLVMTLFLSVGCSTNQPDENILDENINITDRITTEGNSNTKETPSVVGDENQTDFFQESHDLDASLPDSPDILQKEDTPSDNSEPQLESTSPDTQNFPDQASSPQQGLGANFLPQVEEEKLEKVSSSGANISLPDKFDLSAQMPPVRSQGYQGSCVGWAVGYAMKSFQEKIEHQWNYSNKTLMSPAFLFNQIKSMNHNCVIGSPITDCLEGSYIRCALEFLKTTGISTWEDMPYTDSSCTEKPSQSVLTNASNYRILEWKNVNKPKDQSSRTDINTHLVQNYPIIIGITIYNDFRSLSDRNSQIYKDYKKNGKFILNSNKCSKDSKDSKDRCGGHAMIIVGYDDTKEAYKLMNSWGTDWVDNGFIWVSYDTFHKIVEEAYIAVDRKSSPICKYAYTVCRGDIVYNIDSCGKFNTVEQCKYGCDGPKCKAEPPCQQQCPAAENTSDTAVYQILLLDK